MAAIALSRTLARYEAIWHYRKYSEFRVWTSVILLVGHVHKDSSPGEKNHGTAQLCTAAATMAPIYTCIFAVLVFFSSTAIGAPPPTMKSFPASNTTTTLPGLAEENDYYLAIVADGLRFAREKVPSLQLCHVFAQLHRPRPPVRRPQIPSDVWDIALIMVDNRHQFYRTRTLDIAYPVRWNPPFLMHDPPTSYRSFNGQVPGIELGFALQLLQSLGYYGPWITTSAYRSMLPIDQGQIIYDFWADPGSNPRVVYLNTVTGAIRTLTAAAAAASNDDILSE